MVISIIRLRYRSVSSLKETNEEKESDSNMSAPVKVSKGVLIARFMQQLVQSNTSNHGLPKITSIQAVQEVSRMGVDAAYGVIDIVTQSPFSIFVLIFDNLPTLLHEEGKFSASSGSQERIIHQIFCDCKDASNDVNTVPYIRGPVPWNHELAYVHKVEMLMKTRLKATRKKTWRSLRNTLRSGRTLQKCWKNSGSSGRPSWKEPTLKNIAWSWYTLANVNFVRRRTVQERKQRILENKKSSECLPRKSSPQHRPNGLLR